MSIKVRQNLVSSSKYSIKCPYTMTAEYITFHNTANDATANSEINYMIGNNNQVSYHFAIDEKEVVQGIPLNRNAWHCGDGTYGTGNRKSIGVEVCYSKSGGEKYRKAEELAIKFIAQLLHERKWGVDRVKPHKVWSGKYCPHRVFADNRWNAVVAAIQTELNTLKSGKPSQPSPAPSAPKGYLSKGDKGDAVKKLQEMLNKVGIDPKLSVDGIFGNATDSAVRVFQKENRLTVDGIVGNTTMQVLEATIKEEDEMLERAILIGGYPEFDEAELLAVKLKAPIYFKNSLPAGKIAKELYVVGTSVAGLQADKIINLSGKDRIETLKKVIDFLK